MLNNLVEEIEQELNRLIPSSSEPHASLFEAARYALFSGGKRIRPLLTLVTCELLGKERKRSLIPACSLEIVHTYSLIHDDLPAMDNDDLRRGKPTLHRTFPESHAILAGDYLLTLAFELLATAPSLSDSERLALITTLSQASGSKGMIGGQVADLEAKSRELTRSDLEELHRKKTGTLFRASVQFGAILGQAPPIVATKLAQFGETLGVAFQIVDDLLDNNRDEPASYPALLGREKSKKTSEQLHKKALDLLQELPFETILLEKLTRSLLERSH